MTTTPPVFNSGERVLCYHGPLIYEAKVLKAENFPQPSVLTGFTGAHYFVHYKGWKQTWDEWVPAQRLLKLNEQNQALQKQLQQSAAASGNHASTSKPPKTAGKETTSTRTGTRKDGTRGTKRAREDDETSKKPELKLIVPEVLKVTLVDDWEAVTKNNQLVTLPREPNVEQVLQDFAEYLKKEKPAHLREPTQMAPVIVSGLICYFDRSLGANLLYRFERPQYAAVRKQYITGPKVIVGQERTMSQVYGAEHLLRMLVSLPQMIMSSTLDADSVTLLREYVNELLVFMVKERNRIFQAEYDSASLQYQNVSRS
ncbi:MRG-domain-containing protein [Crucibulum laeve]|uniref:Chromatin modification-related protein EAF3 n=1 Tax=Crucibulum laeve TaxID=68775 RepID=A0A5C3LSG9_9AGAR|nr:MRG-domain-containing protein [Crucibulum laeve]